MEKEVLKLDNNTITFERSIIFIASNSKKAKKSFENVRNIKTLSFEKYDLTNYLDHTKDKELILYGKLRTVIQNISFTVVDGILFATNKEPKIRLEISNIVSGASFNTCDYIVLNDQDEVLKLFKGVAFNQKAFLNFHNKIFAEFGVYSTDRNILRCMSDYDYAKEPK